MAAGCSPSKTVPVDENLPVRAVLMPTPGKALLVEGLSEIPLGRYWMPPVEGEEGNGVLRLEGLTDLVLDLSGVEFMASKELAPVLAGDSVGLFLKDCENVTVVGGKWMGYANAIRVEGCRGIHLKDASLDYFWTQALESTVTRDSPLDWLQPMDFVQAEMGGMHGAIEVVGSSGVTVVGCRARHGAVGLVAQESHDCLMTGNDFSFLSAYGVVLANTEGSTVGYNNLEYNVRGYSHGTYASGQNSAGILIVGASAENLAAYNVATHCGSGIYLYGESGAQPRGNLVYGNDCRHGVFASVQTKGTALTQLINNDLSHSLHFGVHSHGDAGLVLLGNDASDVPGTGVGLFSSQDASLLENHVNRNQVGIEIAWGNSGHLTQEAPTGGASRGHHVLGNYFDDNGQDLVARESQALSFAGNEFLGKRQRMHVERIEAWMEPGEDPANAPEEDTVVGWLAGSNGVSPTGNLSGVSLRLWNGDMPVALQEAQVLEPPTVPGYAAGEGRVASEYNQGTESIELSVTGPWDYTSGEGKGQLREPGGLFAGGIWQALWFEFDPETHDPRGDLESWRKLADAPVLVDQVEHMLEPRPEGMVREKVRAVRFGLMAETVVEVPVRGEYRLTVMSDDGIRIWVGEDMVFEDWTWHATRQKDVKLVLEKGQLAVRFEYFQLDGAAELVLELHRVK